MAWNQLAPPAWKGASPRRDPTLKPGCSRPVSHLAAKYNCCYLGWWAQSLCTANLQRLRNLFATQARPDCEEQADRGNICMACNWTLSGHLIWPQKQSKSKSKGEPVWKCKVGVSLSELCKYSTTQACLITELWGGTYTSIPAKMPQSSSDNICDSFFTFCQLLLIELNYVVLANF